MTTAGVMSTTLYIFIRFRNMNQMEGFSIFHALFCNLAFIIGAVFTLNLITFKFGEDEIKGRGSWLNAFISLVSSLCSLIDLSQQVKNEVDGFLFGPGTLVLTCFLSFHQPIYTVFKLVKFLRNRFSTSTKEKNEFNQEFDITQVTDQSFKSNDYKIMNPRADRSHMKKYSNPLKLYTPSPENDEHLEPFHYD